MGDNVLQANLNSFDDDDSLHLAYAGEIERRGDSERAEFIREGCKLARLRRDHPEWKAQCLKVGKLLTPFHKEWGKEVDSILPEEKRGSISFRFDRGLVGIDLDGADFLTFAEEIFAVAPIRTVILRGTKGLIPTLAACPQLRQVQNLGMQNSHLYGFGANQYGPQNALIVNSPFLVNLRRLSLHQQGIRDEGAKSIASCKNLHMVTDLFLGANNIGDEGMQALADCPWMGKLRVLDLSENELGDLGAKALANSPNFGTLEELYLDSYPTNPGYVGPEMNPISPRWQNAIQERFPRAYCGFSNEEERRRPATWF